MTHPPSVLWLRALGFQVLQDPPHEPPGLAMASVDFKC